MREAFAHRTRPGTIYKMPPLTGRAAPETSRGTGTKRASVLVMAERLCAHEPCHCEPDPEAEHCGAYCERAAKARAGRPRPEDPCDCGHPACRPENVPDDQPSPVSQP